MGGSAGCRNRTPYAEFNIWADPGAADIVIKSGLKMTMYGLDVTHQALVTPEIFDSLTAMKFSACLTLHSTIPSRLRFLRTIDCEIQNGQRGD